jgi:hypothetical protein
MGAVSFHAHLALQRDLVGEIVHRFELKGLKIVGMKLSSSLSSALPSPPLLPLLTAPVSLRVLTIEDALTLSSCIGNSVMSEDMYSKT